MIEDPGFSDGSAGPCIENGEVFALESPSDPDCPSQKYHWPLTVKSNGFDPALELINTISLLSKERDLQGFFDEGFAVAQHALDRRRRETMKQYVDQYNAAIRRFRASRNNTVYEPENISTELLQHMMSMIYHRSVIDPSKLNQYKAHTEEVYGEFSSSMISEIVRTVPVKATDRFIDLGSGVGQVVLQVAAEGMCIDSFGIEKQDNPAEYANAMTKNFRKILKWFGKKYGNFDIRHGDFLEEQFRDRIAKADVLVVNNYKFGTALNQELKSRFTELREGTRIVSSLEFSPLNFTISERTLGDIGCILTVKKVTTSGDGVSWTAAPFSYYVHTVDHSMIQEYFNLNGKVPIRASMSVPEPEPEPEPEPQIVQAPEKVVATPAKKRTFSSTPAQPLSTVFDNLQGAASDLDRKWQPKMHRAIPELEVKVESAEDIVEDMHADVEALTSVNAQLRSELSKDVLAKVADVGGRLPGNINLKGKSKYEQQVHIATDVVVNHEIWLRARCRAKSDIVGLEHRLEQLEKIMKHVVPKAIRLSKIVEFLRMSDEWSWDTTLAPSSSAPISKVRSMLCRESMPNKPVNDMHLAAASRDEATFARETESSSNSIEHRLSPESIERAKALLRNLERNKVETSHTNGRPSHPDVHSGGGTKSLVLSESELYSRWVQTYFSRNPQKTNENSVEGKFKSQDRMDNGAPPYKKSRTVRGRGKGDLMEPATSWVSMNSSVVPSKDRDIWKGGTRSAYS